MNSTKPKRIQLTSEGYQKFEKDFQHLTLKRKEVLIRLQGAREMGDLSENGAYKAARFELGSIDRELRRLMYILKMGTVVPKASKRTIVDFGSQVTVENGPNQLTFTLVSEYESDPRKQKLSIESPLGKEIMGKKIGERVTVHAPSGEKLYLIVKVE